MSRLIWFFVGAGVGTWWATHKKIHVDYQFHRIAQPPLSSAPAQQSPTITSEAVQEMRNHQMSYNRDWEQERDRVRQFSQTAGDTVAELSEATLNTILQATEALKAKMAEHRAFREEERRIEEERRRNPPRYV
ncbi:hypothetical protein B0H17DRAFT_112460 [Mycena rosella]|uniref:Uncharacterized protein n=1 Tax=Mycena rosella TaxID=1033263 RepID=A0AAD7G8B5_MYCRO|nr:hypothetical protein B0H17DRAFT_112460 [Mycena rosella]